MYKRQAYLHTVSMNDLYQNIYQSRPPVIDGLLYPGTYLFAGAPKVGKSFLMAQLAYHVSMGLPLWGYPVHKGTVLYLALEDDHRRLQGRLYRMFGTEGTDNLLFAVYAKPVSYTHLGLPSSASPTISQASSFCWACCWGALSAAFYAPSAGFRSCCTKSPLRSFPQRG